MFLKIYENNPSEKSIAKAVEILKNGGVLIYPTDTVYAIGCDMFQQKAAFPFNLLHYTKNEVCFCKKNIPKSLSFR